MKRHLLFSKGVKKGKQKREARDLLSGGCDLLGGANIDFLHLEAVLELDYVATTWEMGGKRACTHGRVTCTQCSPSGWWGVARTWRGMNLECCSLSSAWLECSSLRAWCSLLLLLLLLKRSVTNAEHFLVRPPPSPCIGPMLFCWWWQPNLGSVAAVSFSSPE